MVVKATDIEVVDFELKDDNLMDEDGKANFDASPPRPKLHSVTCYDQSAGSKETRAGGFGRWPPVWPNNHLASQDFDLLNFDGGPDP